MDKHPGPWPLREMNRFLNEAGDLKLPARYFILIDHQGGEVSERATAPQSGQPELAETTRSDAPPEVKDVLVFPVAKTTRNREAAILVGRDEACDIIIDDESVSRTNASLLLSNGLRVLDLGSRNGTSLAGAPAPVEGQKPAAVDVGQSVAFGDVEGTVLDADRLRRLLDALREER